MNKHTALRFALRRLPVPGRYLSTILTCARCNPATIPLPLISKDRWNRINIHITDPQDLIQRHIFFQGYFEYYETVFLRKYLHSGAVFVDIGANIGWHTLMAAKCVGSTGRVIAFEPVASTFAHLAKNVVLNGFTNVELHNIGLGRRSGIFDIFPCEDGNDGANSLYAAHAEKPLEQVRIENGDTVFHSQDIDEIDLCKIDVEGAEFDVLAGLRETLAARKIRCLLIEANDSALGRAGHSVEELFSLLISYGFRLSDLRSSKPVLHASDVTHGINVVATLR